MKKVSVIVPVYNVAAYLKQCLSTLINQSYPKIEIILIDDGSTDSSGIICDDYANLDERVKVIHQHNQGAAIAKNVGLRVASGYYIAFVDSDDYVDLNWVETMVSAMEENCADIAECCFSKVYRNQTMREKSFEKSLQSFSAEEYLSFYLSDWKCSLFWNKIFVSSVLKEIYFRNERRCIDDEFFTYKTISNAKRIIRINKYLYYYRQRLSGAVYSESHQLQITDDAMEILIERYQWVKSKFPKLSKIYYSHDVEILNYFAKNFNFNAKTVKMFQSIRRYYYLRLVCYISRVNLINVTNLMMTQKRQLLSRKPQNSVENKEMYFI